MENIFSSSEDQVPESGGENPFDFKGPVGATETEAQPVWTFRGYRLRASEFTTAMIHFFRAEVQRANVWRQRLDTTTNWAVISTGAALSIAFSQGGANHAVILVNLLLVTTFLLIEARRYRYYELWSYRVRLMETDFFSAMLVPPFHPSPEWAEALAESLLHPNFPITSWEAIGRRLRRNYLYIYVIIGAAWLANLWLFPFSVTSWSVIWTRASIGIVSGKLIFLIVSAFYLAIVILGIWTTRYHQAPGEILPRYGNITESVPLDLAGTSPDQYTGPGKAWFRPIHRRKQLLTLIITDQAQLISEKVIKDLRRGVTKLSGTGMFTGKAHDILLCALTITEIPQLQNLVKTTDPDAFIIVSPAQEIFGKGFSPLQTEEKDK